jgi:hypothetical protein
LQESYQGLLNPRPRLSPEGKQEGGDQNFLAAAGSFLFALAIKSQKKMLDSHYECCFAVSLQDRHHFPRCDGH